MQVETIDLTHNQELATPLVDLLMAKKFDLAIVEFKKIEKQLDLGNLKTIKNGYSRNIFSTKYGYHLTIMNWGQNCQTRIHGHPDSTFVYIISGELINTPYSINIDNKAIRQTPILVKRGEYFFASGKKGTLNNAPHTITTNNLAISLHFYSDDGLKGEVFNRFVDSPSQFDKT